ncbi:MAG: M1 family metallopeptidase [Flavobacteriales bacterium]
MGRSLLFLSFLFLLFFPTPDGSAQAFDPEHPPNTYQNTDNPYYWKNKRPTQGYWQQDVHYRIDARIDEKKQMIRGQMELTYWNHSPDTLREAYFHLYQNAFQPGSYYDKKRGGSPRYGRHGSEGRGTVIDSIRVNGQKVRTELDNTILRVKLPEGLETGEKIEFAIRFRTYFDEKGTWRRMDLFRTRDGHQHYNGVHWYPRISVYDRKFGWTTDQHLGNEFYGDFGTFDVSLNFPSNFIVQATGNLTNRQKVLPDSLRKAIDISNFKDKEWNSPSSTIIPYDSSKRKTWKFHAENVHDFAFTADPTYRIDTVKWNGITCMALVQEPHASEWTNAAEIAKKTIQNFSKDIGPYGHKKIIVADARSGMEYPMLTLCGGRDPSYRDLLVHEIGHEWFFGMVGTNETYRAAMDEGFTQFLTAHGLEELDGDTLVQDDPENLYRKKFANPELAREREVYSGYLTEAIKKNDAVINTHSDRFKSYDKYRQVYYKYSTMLYNLQYVLGDSLFWDAMQHYFEEWRFAHPYFEDFKRSVIQRTGVDLNWFFDQWWNKKGRIDYAVKSVNRIEEGHRIVLERKGKMQMPLDVRIITEDGTQHDHYIPNTWFEKKTDATVHERWIGWGEEFQDSYRFTVKTEKDIREVIIDPSGRLADIDRRDNRKTLSMDIRFDAGLNRAPDLNDHEVAWRPALWYNGVDGIKIGLHSKGDYMEHEGRYKASLWGNTRLLKQANLPGALKDDPASFLSYDLSYRTGTEEWIKGSELGLGSRWNAGLSRHYLKWSYSFPSGEDNLSIRYTAMQRPKEPYSFYLNDGMDWGVGHGNRFLELNYRHTYGYPSGNGVLKGSLRSQALSPAYDMSWARFSANNRSRIGPLLLRSRLLGQYGTGSDIPPESMLYLAGGNPEQMMEDPLTRAQGNLAGLQQDHGPLPGNFQYGGGLGVRGYNGYLAPSLYEKSDTTFLGHRGISGAAINLELEFQEALGIRIPSLDRYFDVSSYLFFDAGVLDLNPKGERAIWGPVRMDAGIGTSVTLEQLGPVEDIEPVTFRFDMPIFLNRTPAKDPAFIQFRWLFGISRAF